MSADSWSHAICDRCWTKRHPGQQPIRVRFPRPNEDTKEPQGEAHITAMRNAVDAVNAKLAALS